MLNHVFTLKEKIIALVVALVLFGLGYYNFIFQAFQKQIQSFSTDTLESELLVEQSKSAKISQMKQIITESEGKIKGDLSVYNNQAQEIVEMGRIYDEDGYDVSAIWSEPTLEGNIVRRDVSIKFSANSYRNFKNILQKMSEMKYRCLIKDTTVSNGSKEKDSGGLEYTDKLNGAISVTFFETTDGAQSLSGLQIVEDPTDLSDSEIANRAHAYEE